MDFQPVLENDLVQIRPLKDGDFDSLFTLSSDPLLWEQHPAKERATIGGFTKWFTEAMATERAFLIQDKESGQTVGTSRYNPSEVDENVIEIGWTFIGRAFWGGQYNQSVKKLMMDYAFEYYDRVLFFVDKSNLRSQKAVVKIGGKEIDAKSFEPRSLTSVVFCVEKPQLCQKVFL